MTSPVIGLPTLALAVSLTVSSSLAQTEFTMNIGARW